MSEANALPSASGEPDGAEPGSNGQLQALKQELLGAKNMLQAKMRELEATHNAVASLLESRNVGAVFVDTSLRLLAFTPSCNNVLKLSQGDIGRPLEELAPRLADPSLLPEVRAALDSLVPSEKEVAGEEGRWFLREILPSRTIAQGVDGVVIAFVDVTDRRRGVEDAREYHAQLRLLNRMKDEFLAMLSHELRTPLSTIMLWAGVLQDASRTSAHLERGLEIIAQSAEAQSRLIGEMIDIARLSSGNLRLELTEMDITPVVESVVLGMAPTAEAKGIALEAELAENVGRVRMDAERVRQILWHLLGNAVKFTQAGGKVAVTLKRVGQEIHLSVVDNGEGIRSEFLPHVFDRFRQSDTSATRRYGGLGLGLAISKELVELHGGSLHAQSDGEGKGAAFTVKLPATDGVNRDAGGG